MIERPGDMIYNEEPRAEARENDVARYVAGVMGWMFVGLLTTAVVTLLCLSSYTLQSLLFSGYAVYFGVVIAQLVLAIGMGAMFRRLSPAAATVMFMAYSALMGVTMTVLVAMFDTLSVVFAFGLTAFVFASLAVYGFVTKRDLTRIGTLALFGLIGVIAGGVINIFLGNALLDFVITCVGVVIFVALIAYDTQKVKAIYIEAAGQGFSDDHPEVRKLAIFGAFMLYLDFINLFIRLLSLFGKRRN